MMKNEENASSYKRHDKKSSNKEIIISESQETDQFHMWDCTPISDIKLASKLKIISEKRPKKDEYISIVENYKVKNAARVRCSDNPKCLGTVLEKLSFYLKNTGNKRIAIARDEAIFHEIPVEEFKARYNVYNI